MKPYLFLFFSGCMIAGFIISSAGAASPEARAQWKIANDLFNRGECSSALVASEEAISMDPLFGAPWNMKGSALHCLGRDQEALEAFTKAIELDPSLDIARKNLDHVQLEIKNEGSYDAEVQWKIAKNLSDSGECSSALVASEKAISMNPQVGKYWNVKGCALHCLGRNREALEAFTKAVELDPSLTIAQKNLDHVQLDIKNGAPLDKPAIVLPAVRNASIAYDGELGYDPIGKPTGSWAFSTDGHAVFYANNRTIAVTGIRMAGCRYGEAGGKVRVEIWDKNFTTLYSDTIPYDQIPFTVIKDKAGYLTNSSWVDIDLPDHEVSGDFYIVLFTGSVPISDKEPMMYIVYYTPSETGTSYAMTTNPNRPDVQKIGKAGYRPEELDWMIHVLYTIPPSKTVTPGELQALKTQVLKTQTEETQKSTPTSTPLGLISIVGALSIVVSYSIFKK
ncbi:MAG: tetratricopeptide repeat protein [Methanoregula sp.]|nr:tetratricopeptide repeat protein [Methanoregula sp.]